MPTMPGNKDQEGLGSGPRATQNQAGTLHGEGHHPRTSLHRMVGVVARDITLDLSPAWGGAVCPLPTS